MRSQDLRTLADNVIATGDLMLGVSQIRLAADEIDRLRGLLDEAFPYVRRCFGSEDLGPESLPTRIFDEIKKGGG
jgi:hypothetical protein